MRIIRLVFPKPREVELVKDDGMSLEAGPTEVVVKTLYTLISAGTELAYYANIAGLKEEAYPFQPGYGAIVEVVQVGSEVKEVAEGDTLFSTINHVSMDKIDMHTSIWAKLPKDVDPVESLLVRMATVSMTTLRTTRARPGDWVAVVGLGPVGFCAAQMAHASGYRVLGIDLLPERRERLTQVGLPSYGIEEEELSHILDRTGGGCHLVIEASGNAQGTVTGLRLAKTGGEVVLVGVPWSKKTNVLGSEILDPVFHKYITLRSGWEWELPLKETPFSKGSIQDNTHYALNLLKDEKVSFRSLVTHVLPIRDAQQAYEGLLQDKENYVGVVLDWRAE